jgi:translocator protein
MATFTGAVSRTRLSCRGISDKLLMVKVSTKAVMIKSWMIIGIIAFLVGFAGNWMTPNQSQWFRQLQRPRWLTFESAIPLIWTVIFICGAWSAYIIWEHSPNSDTTRLMMVLYLLLEVFTIAYTPVMLHFRSLIVGTIIGGTGLLICLLITLAVLPVSTWSALLLLPYLLWSPIGTYTTWEMSRLNPEDA